MLEALIEKDGVSSRRIANRIDMPNRTVRYALRILKSKDLVIMKPVLGDTRRKIYLLNEDFLEKHV